MANILITYSTVDGHTLEICRRLKHVIEQQSHEVALCSIEECYGQDLTAFDKIVIGASIRYGKHRLNVFDFIRSHQQILDSRPSAFFSVNVVARKPGKNRPETNPYVQKFLRKTSWRPGQLAVFAGKIDYPRYGFLDRTMIRLIMWMTNGPTDTSTVNEFTDWEQVEVFGRQICNIQAA